VDWTQDATGFPKISGVRFPKVIQQPSFNDYGPSFLTQKIITTEPPVVKADYKVLVGKCDKDGNSLGMLSPPEVAVPLGTFTGWNLRRKEFGADAQLTNLLGSFIAFEAGISEVSKADPRREVTGRYDSMQTYLKRLDDQCQGMVAARYLLEVDRPRYAGYGTAIWNFVTK
jgi:hypothetical protein